MSWLNNRTWSVKFSCCTLRPRKLRPCKLRSNFYFIRGFPQSLHIFNLASCVLQVAVSVCFPPKIPQLARFMCNRFRTKIHSMKTKRGANNILLYTVCHFSLQNATSALWREPLIKCHVMDNFVVLNFRYIFIRVFKYNGEAVILK